MKNSGSLGCKFHVGGASVMDMTNEPRGTQSNSNYGSNVVVNVNENVVSKESNYKPCLDTHIWDMAIPDCNKKLVATYGPLTAVIQTANRTTKKAPLKSETFGTMSWTKE